MALIRKNRIEYVGISNTLPPPYSVCAFKQLLAQEYITLPRGFDSIDQIVRLSSSVEIINTYKINTPASTKDNENEIINASGQVISGLKLIVEGIIHHNMVYAGQNTPNTLLSFCNDYYFGTYIALPSNTSDMCSCYTVKPIIEDIIVEAVNPRNITKCISIFLCVA